MMWQELPASFHEKHPDIDVQTESVTDRYEAKIQQLLMAGVAPNVMGFQDESFPRADRQFDSAWVLRGVEGLAYRL